MKRVFLILFYVLFLVASAWATHNRAGEITYRHISGNTYEFTVYTYTKTSSIADRPWLPVNWGDGSPADSIQRDQDNHNINYFDAQQNIYIKTHTFPGSGLYNICVSDPNRIAGILNINSGGSVEVEFAIQTTLRISASIAPNNSVIFTNLPLQDACLFQPWVYNPGAIDLDREDSLSYKLVPSMDRGCIPFDLGFYEYPNQIPITPPGAVSPNPLQELQIDVNTGTIIWEVPQRQGEYNLAIIVEEWRDGALIGTVLRDMQIAVSLCDNNPPVIEALKDTCIEAGSLLTIPIYADDPDAGSEVVISGYGAPFVAGDSHAEIIQVSETVPTSATFSWLTSCSHVQLKPHKTVIQATDNGPGTSLVDIETFNITVVAPPPENLLPEAIGVSVELSWDPSVCSNAEGYRIYKRLDEFGFQHGPCETGVPAYTGYEQIAEIEGLNNTSYSDGIIIFGRQNCYMVVAYFEDGAESYASEEMCTMVDFIVPIIKKNSVGITDIVGVDTVRWRSPEELDLDIFQGPYQYKLFRGNGYESPSQMVFESSIESDMDDLTVNFIDDEANTLEDAQTYRVDLYNDGLFLISSATASSIFLELIPNDNQIEITWIEAQTWVNFEYEVYRQEDGVGAFELLATIDTIGYLDLGLKNNRDYCYYIVAKGSYDSPLENDTLINYSQRVCAKPYDRTPPCPPVLAGEGDCEVFTVDLEWTNPNETCPETDDVVEYNIYYAPVEGMELIYQQTEVGDMSTVLNFIYDNSIAGCYGVTALDTLAPWPDGTLVQNESEMSNLVCFDNCPNYTLPNVITPNGDGRNDYFSPFPYRSVESIELTIFNRWGGIVFQSTDPDILWDGTSSETGELVPDGTYYYACTVYSIRLSGLDPVNLSGYVSVFVDGGNGSTK